MEIIEKAPERIMVVTPHPDDAEGGCGATMAKWVKEYQTQVVVVLCTNGDKGTGDRSISPDVLASIREVEQQNASDLLGVQNVVFLRHPDGGLENDQEFRRELVKEIRRYRPQIIFCIDPYRSTTHTHRDHRMSGQTALDAACSYAWSSSQFPEHLEIEGLEPHKVEQAFLWGSEYPDVFIDVEGYLDVKAQSLSAHVSQMVSSTHEERLERIRNRTGDQGKLVGLKHAESFRRINFNLNFPNRIFTL